MNAHCFKTVFSKRLGSLVAVGEHASSQGKATGASTPAHNISSTSSAFSATWGTGFCGALSTTFAFVTLAWASPAWAQPATNALPTGGQVVQGAVQFNTQAQQLNITQSSDRAAVNWQSFDIGAAAKVHVVQPSAQSVLLNRVGGEAPSQIFGQLQANGQVILVNPNGMVFGKDGSVSAAGFSGATLNISDADFMAGKERYTRSGTAAATSAIVNRGLIQAAPGGYVALLGASVSNEGRIEAPQGNVFMAAADAVTLPSQASTVGVPIGQSGRIKLELTPASINAAVANHKGGTIVTEGGQVYLQAAAVNAALASIIQSGSIDTTGVKGGQVHVLADGGHIRVNGSIKANSTDGSAGGDIYMGRDKDTNVLAAVGDASGARLESKGGFVETSGSFLKTDGVQVMAKDWLLDPSDITISSSANSNVTGTSPADITPNGVDGTSSIVQVSTIQDAINQGTNVTIRTTNTLNPTGAGNITIANALNFNNTGPQAATLSLIADNGITVNSGASITGTGTQLVNISMTANGNFQGNPAASANSRGINLGAAINTNGAVVLDGTTKNTGTGFGTWVNAAVTGGSVDIKGTSTNDIGLRVAGAINTTSTINGLLKLNGTGTTGIFTSANLTSAAALDINGIGSGNSTTNNGWGYYQNNNVVAQGTAVTIKGESTGTGTGNPGVILMNGAGVKATTSMDVTGTSAKGHGIFMSRTSWFDGGTTADVTLTGTAQSNNTGILLDSANAIIGKNISLIGKSTSVSGGAGFGFLSIMGPGNGNRMTASGNLSIHGTVDGAGTGSGVRHATTNWQNLINDYRAGGTLSITGTNAAAATNTDAAVSLRGVQASAGGDITVSGIHNNAAADAVFIFSDSYNSGGAAPGYQGGATSLRSTGGNTTIKSNQGNIYIQDGTPNSVISTAITGRNVIIDNTGGTFSGGMFTAGTGTSTSTTVNRAGVYIGDSLAGNDLHINNAANSPRRTITASDANGQIVINGKSTGSNSTHSSGVRIASTVGFVANTTAITGSSSVANAVELNAALTTTGDITLSGDRMNIGANVRAGSTGANTVTVKTVSAGNKIDIGSGTGVSGVDVVGTLGLSQAELNRITAGNLVIGDTANTGGITVSAATTTNATSGNLTLVSGGNIAINGALTVGSATPSKNLTLHGAGATSTVTQTAAVKAAGLELLGSNATHTLDNAGNDVKKLAGNTKTVSLINQGDLEVSTVNTEGLTGTGTVSISTTAAGNITLMENISAAEVNLNAAGAVLRDAALATDGIIQATSLLRINAGTTIGTSASRIQTDVATLSMFSGGDQFVTEANAVTVAARTTNNGSIDIAANGGTMTVGSSTLIPASVGAAIDGVTTHGSGTITLSGTSNTADGLVVSKAVTADTGNITLSGTSSVRNGIVIGDGINLTTTGDVSLTGTTSATSTSTTGPWAGISFRNISAPVAGTVSGRNITMNASATGTSGNALGYWGRNARFIASETLKMTGSSVGNNALFQNVGGLFSSGTGMTVTGTSQANNSAIALVAGMTIINGSSGGISITGTALSSQAAFLLGDSGINSITNSGSDGVKLTALKGNIVLNSATNTITNNGTGAVNITAGNGSDTDLGAIDGTKLTINQNGNGVVEVQTSGLGNVTAPKIINNGIGNVTVAAGTAIGAGTGTGGQVKTALNNTITQNSTGKTYIYTGNATDTGLLSDLGAFSNGLFLSTIGADTKNAVSNTGYGSTIAGGANAQVMFREKVALSGSLADATNTYGDSTTNAAVLAKLQVDNLDATVLETTSAAGTFKITKTDLMTDVAIGSASVATALNDPDNLSTSLRLEANTTTGYAIELTGSNYTLSSVSAKLKVGKLALTGVTIDDAGNTYGGTVAGGAINVSGANKFAADEIEGIASVVSTGTDLSSSGKLKAGTYFQTADGTALSGADASNYSLAPITTATANYVVDRLALTGSIALGSSTYGSTLTPGAVTLSNKVGTDDVSATGVTIVTANNTSTSGNLRAGSYTGIQSVIGLTGNDRDNYTFADVKGDYTVGQLALTSSIAAVTTVYGTAATTGAVAVSAGLIGDDVRVSPTAVATLVGAVTTGSGNLAAGSYLQSAAAALEGADAGNYTTLATTVANYVVTPRVINASVTAADKVYDGNVAATLVATSADILLGDVVNVTGLTGSFASRNVARDGAGNVLAQVVTVSGSAAALGGADGSNYVLGNAASVPATTARITPRELSVSGITASDKVYDGNTTAVISVANAALANVVAADSVSVSAQNAQGNFADKDVARGAAGQVLAKAVQVSGLQLQGADAGNYNLQANGVSAQASITPRPVSLSGNSAVDKVADGTTTAQVIAGSLNGLVAGESLNVNAQGEFEDALVGTNKAVNARFALQNGALGLASNYQLSNPVEVLRASIVAFVPGKVSPEPIGGGSTQGSRVSFGGGPGTGAATGVNDDPVDPVVAQCSVLNPEKCECVETPQPGVELCFVPVQRVSLKD